MKSVQGVQALDRALRLLELLVVNTGGIRLSDLARQAKLAPSAKHRLLTALELRGFAQLDPIHTLWHMGRRAFTAGIAYTHWQSFIAPRCRSYVACAI